MNTLTTNSSDARRPPGTRLAFLLVLALAALWGCEPLVHDDLFFHLRTGELAVEEGTIPTTDPFSFTRFGERWVSHEWGFGLIIYLVYRAGGLAALLALQAALAVAVVLWLRTLVRRTAGPEGRWLDPWLPAFLALGLWAVGDELILRAALFSALFLVWELLLLQAFRDTGRRRHLVLLAGLFLVWGNLHSGVIFGLFVLALAAAEAVLGGVLGDRAPALAPLLRRSRPGAHLAALAAAAGLALVNPNGLDALLYPVRLRRVLYGGGLTLDMGHFSPPTPLTSPAFFLLLAVLLAGFLPARRARLPSLSQGLGVAAFLALALSSHRFLFEFAVLAVPVAFLLHARRDPAGLPAPLRSGRLAPLATAAALTLAILSAATGRPPGLLSRHFPQAAARVLEEEGIEGRLFNHQNYGGYLGWRLRTPIFWDGRNLLFAPLMRELRGLSWPQVVARYGIDHLVVTEHEWSILRRDLDPRTWGLVHWDDFSAVYLRRVPRFGEALERRELRLLPPFGGVVGLDALARSPTAVEAARRELDQVLAAEPRTQRALYLKGLVSHYRGDQERAWDELTRALALGPNPHVEGALERVRARLEGRRP